MSAFECNITPTRIRNAKKRNEDKEPTIVDLRPFTGKSIVTFEDVPITKVARRIITVLNPFPEILKISITKKPKGEHNVAFEWLQNEILPESCVHLEVVWNPLKVVSCREILEITDHFGNRKTISIILKSCELPKTIKRKVGGMDFNKKLKLKAPSPPKIILNRHISSVSNAGLNRHDLMEHYIVEEERGGGGGENLFPLMSPKRKTHSFATSIKSPLRNATNIQHHEEEAYSIPAPNIGKENNAKINTPTNNASSLFDSLKFTPLTETKPKCESKLEYLTSLPTPIALKRDDIVVPKESHVRFVGISPDMQRNIIIETSHEINIEETPKRHLMVKSTQHHLATKLVLEEVEEIEVENEHLTYIKGPSSEEINEIEIILTNSNTPTMNKATRFSTPDHNKIKDDVAANKNVHTPENDSTHLKVDNNSKLQTTFKINKSRSFNENFIQSETFECKPVAERIMSESMREPENMPTYSEKEKLKANQGSMPNLNDINVRHIEHNRYFYQETCDLRPQNLSMESVVSNVDFKELETCAQSSRLNLNEIGNPSKSPSPVIQFQQSRFDQNNKSKYISPAKYQRERLHLSPTIQRIKEEQEFDNSSSSKKKVLTFSPPRTKLSDINEMYRRETFVVSNSHGRDIRATTWKQQQNQQLFAVPRVPRESSVRSKSSTISQSLTSLSSSMTSIASTSSMPATSGKLYNENVINAYKKKDPFCATTTEDPFLTSSMYLDEHTLDRIEKSFKKWLNALVTIPPDLETDRNEKVDVAKLFNDVQNKELTLAPTKELVCSQYYTARLDQLRSMAVRFFHSNEISKPLNKLAVIINEKKLLEVHSARNIHLDVVLQRSLLELLLCFNPLWLRIGLEVVFNVQLNLHSNQDILGMSRFIINNMFKSPYLQQKFSKYHQQQELLDKLKKHTAKNFLFLLFFLDRAKENRLIKQNPCLFIKSAPYKETAEILKKFASLVLANYGDIIRMLKRLDYVLSHKQTVIDEFDYAFKNLAIDLRDGVRLTKVMEVILLRDDLVKKVRVPAISRLQKVHNVELAMKALEAAEYKILGNITAKDIADGHREKTLSLLWQIIYKFRAPRFNAAAKVIQKFWRSKWLKIFIERRIRLKEQEKLNNAAIVIQKYYRGWKTRQAIKEYHQRVRKSCIILQKYIRGYLARKHYKSTLSLVKFIQQRYRLVKQTRTVRRTFVEKKVSVVKIQIWWRKQILIKKILASSIVIKQILKEERDKNYQAIVKIQKFWRGYRLMLKQRRQFVELKVASCIIQTIFRGKLQMRQERNNFLLKKKSAIKIQQTWRATLEMRKCREQYTQSINKIVFIQRKFRANQAMKRAVKDYQEQKCAVVKIQNWFRSIQQTIKIRNEYLILKKKIIATIVIQKYYRGWKARQAFKEDRQRVIKACTVIQKHIRGYLARKHYKSTLKMVKFVQQRYRTRIVRKIFVQKKVSIVKIQIWWKKQILIRKIQTTSIVIKKILKEEKDKRNQAALKIQNYWRGHRLMMKQRNQFLELKKVSCQVQAIFRGKLQMKRERNNFLLKKKSAIKIQQTWKSTLEMRKCREQYIKSIQKIIFIQRKFRANQAMRQAIKDYERQKCAIIKIQNWFRSHQQAIKIRNEFLTLKKTVLMLENRIIANRLQSIERQKFIKLKNATKFVQQRFRSKLETRKMHQQFVKSKEVIYKLQTYSRGYLARQRFKELQTPENIEKRRQHKAARMIQAAWRGYKERSKKCNRCFSAIVQRLVKASKNVDPSQTLASKLKISIEFLKYRYDSSIAISMLAKLEYIARTVPWMLIEDAEFVSAFCMGIMGQAIRSEVDKQIIELCSCIILNLGRYHATKEDAFQESGLITISQMLLRWCDKDCGIFNTLCTLIWVFSHCKKKKRIIRNFMTMKDGEYIISQIKQNVLRKENMRKNSRRPIGFQSISLIKYKKDYQLQLRHQPQTVYSSGFITPEMLKQCREMPSMEPDYGVVRMHPYIFYSSVFAFDTILSALDINIVK